MSASTISIDRTAINLFNLTTGILTDSDGTEYQFIRPERRIHFFYRGLNLAVCFFAQGKAKDSYGKESFMGFGLTAGPTPQVMPTWGNGELLAQNQIMFTIYRVGEDRVVAGNLNPHATQLTLFPTESLLLETSLTPVDGFYIYPSGSGQQTQHLCTCISILWLKTPALEEQLLFLPTTEDAV